MQYDPFRSSRDLGLTWPEVKLWPWPFKVNLYMVRRALLRQTRWYQNRCSIFKIKDFIVENPFWKILEFWPLETPILTWAKKWPKWFRNDFSRAFERCLSFFSTATRSRDDGGGGVQTPPPPSRRWKIQRPSRARVKRLLQRKAAWTRLAGHSIEVNVDTWVRYGTKKLTQLRKTIRNPFWSNVVHAWYEFVKGYVPSIEEVLSENIWFSGFTKFSTTVIKSWDKVDCVS